MKKIIGLFCIAAALTGCGSDAGENRSDNGSGADVKASVSSEDQSETSAAETTSSAVAKETSTKAQTTEKATAENVTQAKTTEEKTTAAEERTTAVQPEKNPAAETPAATPAGGISYRQALENILYNRTLPDGTSLPDDGYDITANRFAVYDVDGDGSDELIFNYENTAMAGMSARVYAHDAYGNIITELRGFPSMRFYDSGVIEVNISHNQGFSGDFWPYSLYRYDPGTDVYKNVAFVEAMDKALVERINEMAAGYGGEPYIYPEEADTSGSGFVYYIRPDGNSGDVSPVDVTEYDAWHEQYVGGAQQINLTFMKLTEENIQTIN